MCLRASLTSHALRRLLGIAALAALLAGTPANAQVATPAAGSAAARPATPAGGAWHAAAPSTGGAWQSVPDVDALDEDGAWDWDDDDEPDAGGGALPLPSRPAPGAGAPPWPLEDELPAVTSRFVRGRVARLRKDGKAAIPLGAPKRVRALIAHYNRIAGKPYKWGGGHGSLADSGYDCSGAVGYGLIKGGLLRTTMVSGSLARWGTAGPGRWVTVYANGGHVYAEIAGLRMDTSAVGDRGGRKGVRWRPAIGKRSGFKVRHPAGL